MFWLCLTLFSGFMNGSFPVPMKYVKKWDWEHTWSIWSFWAFLILPCIIALLTVPNIFHIYAAESKIVIKVFLIGCIYGIAAITFGLGIKHLGMALGFAIIMGLTTSIGSLIPLFIVNTKPTPEQLRYLYTGIITIVFGIAFCSYAGHLKEINIAKIQTTFRSSEKSFLKGLLLCILAGISGPCLNIAFIYGSTLMQKSQELGTNPIFSTNPIWAIALPGAFLVNLSYCVFLMISKKNYGSVFASETGRNWLLTLLMGIAWMGSVILYGISSVKLGKIGSSIGWAAFLGTAIIVGNIWGLFTGEWKNCSRLSLFTLITGVLVIGAGIAILACGRG
jgi:L-rhamnose-H+ transport protein